MGPEIAMSPPPADAAATYLYCLLRHGQPADLGEPPAGLPGTGPPRLLEADGDLWLVVATAPLPEFSAESIEARLEDLSWVSVCAVAHERVVEHFMESEALIPVKLWTQFHSDQQALAHVGEHRQRLELTLSRISRHREWGVRVRLLPGPKGLGGADREAARPASGREFLSRKREQRLASRALARQARELARDAWLELEGAATAAQRHASPEPELEDRMLLEAAFLVPVTGAERFEAVVARWAERLASASCELTLTGPWPPYNFVGDEA
jgi:hypothetical protein